MSQPVAGGWTATAIVTAHVGGTTGANVNVTAYAVCGS
jgi:hypothetical protein